MSNGKPQLGPDDAAAIIAAPAAIGYGRQPPARTRLALIVGDVKSVGRVCVARADGPEGIRRDQALMASIADGVKMPELSRSVVHDEGVALVDAWIETLAGVCQ